MPTSPILTEQLAAMGMHLPVWPEEPEEGGATGDWIQRGQAYAEGVRLWRAQLRNAPESTKGVVDQFLRHLHDTGQAGGWDQLMYAAIKPEVQGTPAYEDWQACTKLIRSSTLTPAQLLGITLAMAEGHEPMPAIAGLKHLLNSLPDIDNRDISAILLELISRLDLSQLIESASFHLTYWTELVELHEHISALAKAAIIMLPTEIKNAENKMPRVITFSAALDAIANIVSNATWRLPRIERYCKANQVSEIKLHLGCGGNHWPGWINIDNFDYTPNDSSRSGSEYDIKMNIQQLEVGDNMIEAISIIHTLEHFNRWEAIDCLRHFFRKLKKGGLLHVEMPDLDKCIEWYLNGEKSPHIETPLGSLNMGFTQFYGNQWDMLPFETHKYVWTKSEFENALKDAGFTVKEIHNEKSSHQKGRDMYIVAIKTQ